MTARTPFFRCHAAEPRRPVGWRATLTAAAVVGLFGGALIQVDGGAIRLGADAAFAGNGNGNGGGGGGNGGGGGGHGGGGGNGGGNGNGGGGGGNGGGGGGNGGGGGGGNGNGNGGGHGNASTDRSGPPEWSNGGGNGNGGAERGVDRYAAAIDAQIRGNGNGNGRGGGFSAGTEVATFDAAETDALIASGWQTPASRADGFANHGQRVRTFVAIARELGLSPSVGALQANFGTPAENGLADLSLALADAEAGVAGGQEALAELELQLQEAEEALAEALAAEEGGEELAGEEPVGEEPVGDKTVAELEAEVEALKEQIAEVEADLSLSEEEIAALEQALDEAVAGVKPGQGPSSGWETENLDVNGDGIVDGADLVAARNGGTPGETEEGDLIDDIVGLIEG